MSESHTPGPWGWQFFGPHLALVGKHSDRPIVLDVTPKGVMRLRVGHIMRPITMVAECEEHPDFRLIKAAPDLLAACRDASTDLLITANHAREVAKTDNRWGGVADQLTKRREQVEAAIAKARGAA